MLEIAVYIRPDNEGRFTSEDRKLLAMLVDFMPDGGKPSFLTADDPEPAKDSPVAKAEEPEEKPAPKPRRSTAKKPAPAKSEDDVAAEEDAKTPEEDAAEAKEAKEAELEKLKAEPEPEEVTTEPEEGTTEPEEDDTPMALSDDSDTVTLDDAVQAATSVAKAQGKAVVVEALKSVGAKRVTEIEPAKLGDFITALKG